MIDINPALEVPIQHDIANIFHQWATAPHSEVLAIGQRQNANLPAPVNSISAQYVWFARKARLPVVSHFCSLPGPGPKGQSSYERGLVALAYSILRQFIELAPPLLDCCLGGHLESLDLATGTVSSWEKVLSAIDTVLHFMPPLLICIIDGLDVIYNESTDDHIRSLLRILFRHASYPEVIPMYDRTTKSVLFKGLITVTGQPSWLMEALAENRKSPDTPTAEDDSLQKELVRIPGSDLWAVTMSSST